MPVFVVLLRGVNVGKANRVPMGEFRALLSGLGYEGVVTLLNSGNAVFSAARGTAKKHAEDIAAALMKVMNVKVPVVVKTATDLGAVIAGNPFEGGSFDPSRLLVAFSQNREALAALSAIRTLVRPPEQFAIGKHAAYLLCPAGILKSNAGEAILGRTVRNITTRNLATTLKLHAVAQG